jgi:hypothetical protein
LSVIIVELTESTLQHSPRFATSGAVYFAAPFWIALVESAATTA